jgi:hypothetical protein
MYIQDREEEMKLHGFVPGDRYPHDLLRQYQPGCGHLRGNGLASNARRKSCKRR